MNVSGLVVLHENGIMIRKSMNACTIASNREHRERQHCITILILMISQQNRDPLTFLLYHHQYYCYYYSVFLDNLSSVWSRFGLTKELCMYSIAFRYSDGIVRFVMHNAKVCYLSTTQMIRRAIMLFISFSQFSMP